jgi:hypothetical protein
LLVSRRQFGWLKNQAASPGNRIVATHDLYPLPVNYVSFSIQKKFPQQAVLNKTVFDNLHRDPRMSIATVEKWIPEEEMVIESVISSLFSLHNGGFVRKFWIKAF